MPAEEHKLVTIAQVRSRLLGLTAPASSPAPLRPDKFGGPFGVIVSEADLEQSRRPARSLQSDRVECTPLIEAALQTDFRRAAGALFGLATGDALGSTLEFKAIDGLAFPALMPGPHRDMAGDGPFHLLPGQVTD